MSTPPPNFGYTQIPAAAPPDGSTRRAQGRIDKTQARRERDQMRQGMRAGQRRSITAPILLVTLGILLLLLQAGRLHWSNVLTWLSLWWPAILIATGILMTLEWALDNRISRTAGVPVPRRILGGAATTLLLLLAILGAALMIARRSTSFFQDALSAPLIGNGRNNWTELFGVHSDFTSEQTASLGPNGEITIDNPHGDVTVTGSSPDGLVHLSVHQHLFALQHDDLNARHLREQPRFRGDRDHLTLTAVPEGEDDADFTVQLPHNASLIIRSGHGDVNVEELHGTTVVGVGNGDVKLTALRGPVRIEASNDDATITAHSLGGGLTLNGHSGDIDLSDIDGGIALHGDFFGTTKMERIRGDVNFQSSFTRFSCAGIPGNLVIEGRSDLTAKHLQGQLVLATTDRNLTLDGLRGAATITNRNGSVNLTLAAPLQPLHVTNINGTVDLSIPDHQPFTLHARAQDAAVHTDFNLPVTQAGSVAVLEGKVLGGGPVLDVETTNDDIGIHSTQAADTGSWSDTPDTEAAPSSVRAPAKHASRKL